METKHTKGEWEVFKPDHMGCTNVSIGKNAGFNQFVELWHHQNSKEESEANAKLIAAAPELLEALININNILNSAYQSSKDEEILDITINAIKKATE